MTLKNINGTETEIENGEYSKANRGPTMLKWHFT